MNDKEILIQAAEKVGRTLASNLFGISSAPSQILINYIIKNLADKYDTYLNLLLDKNNNINIKILEDALKAEIKARNGFKIANIKFNEDDVDELIKAYNDIKNTTSNVSNN